MISSRFRKIYSPNKHHPDDYRGPINLILDWNFIAPLQTGNMRSNFEQFIKARFSFSMQQKYLEVVGNNSAIRVGIIMQGGNDTISLCFQCLCVESARVSTEQ